MAALTIGTWNCRMAFDKKWNTVAKRGLKDLDDCDVLVVPECRDDNKLASGEGDQFLYMPGRFPDYPKGLGVFAFHGWKLEKVDTRKPLDWVLPIRLKSPSGEQGPLLLAMWAVEGSGRPSFTQQVAEAIAAWEGEIGVQEVILAGDFNCSSGGPNAAPHAANVARLRSLGSHSAYHRYNGLEHGAEKDMTLRWIGPGRVETDIHCDFIFLSGGLADRLDGVAVGKMSEWVSSELSDHAPVVARIASAKASPT